MISVVTPVFNEQESLEELYARLKAVLGGLNTTFELIVVDDGSSDRTVEIAQRLAASDARVKLVSLSRNFGHQVALTAGLDFAEGEVTIMMDADLQHPPELIPQLIAKWEEGFDVVDTIRLSTAKRSRFSGWASDGFYWLMNKMTNVKIKAGSADFRLMDRQVVESFRQMRERDRFLRGLVQWIGFRHAEVPYHAPVRFAGRAKYSVLRSARLAFDGITSFTALPLYLSGLVGTLISILGFLYGLQAIYYRYFTNRAVEGYTSVIVAVMFLGGINLVSLGVIGLYIGRIYTETKARPLYLVRQLVGFRRNLSATDRADGRIDLAMSRPTDQAALELPGPRRTLTADGPETKL